ncbi:hypothetical protein M885DRAFT_90795 [Pelagophyceae sp. CCMP2097]|nr:hypothetical protein M885DRAFT_90795 [Pelagophyceae sp. CCMP2097]
MKTPEKVSEPERKEVVSEKKKPPTKEDLKKAKDDAKNALELAAQREARGERYQTEIDEMQVTIDANRDMWEKLVRDSEKEIRDLRAQIAVVASDRDRRRKTQELERKKTEDEENVKSMTDELVLEKMQAAELLSEIELLRHHEKLMRKRFE